MKNINIKDLINITFSTENITMIGDVSLSGCNNDEFVINGFVINGYIDTNKKVSIKIPISDNNYTISSNMGEDISEECRLLFDLIKFIRSSKVGDKFLLAGEECKFNGYNLVFNEIYYIPTKTNKEVYASINSTTAYNISAYIEINEDLIGKKVKITTISKTVIECRIENRSKQYIFIMNLNGEISAIPISAIVNISIIEPESSSRFKFMDDILLGDIITFDYNVLGHVSYHKICICEKNNLFIVDSDDNVYYIKNMTNIFKNVLLGHKISTRSREK